jgi:hypothetical protein
MKSQVQYSKTQFSLLLIHQACQISVKLFGESIPSVYVRTSLSVDKKLHTPSIKVDWSGKSESNKNGHISQKAIKNNRLPSMKIIFISKIPPFGWRCMFRNPQARAVTTGQTKIPNSICTVREKHVKRFHNQFSSCFIE